MAYGFGTTFGTSGTTDRIVPAATYTQTMQMTVMLWVYRRTGIANFAKMWGTGDGSSGFRGYNRDADTSYVAAFTWSGSSATWSTARPSLDVWHHVAVTYDGSDGANDPVMYIDGTPQAVTELVAPSGTLDTTTALSLCIGNHPTVPSAAWDGLLAEFSIHPRIVAPAEITAHAKGLQAQPPGTIYHPLIRQTADVFRASAGAVTGAVRQAHPPTIFSAHGPQYTAAVSTFVMGTGIRRTLSALGTRMGSRQAQEA